MKFLLAFLFLLQTCAPNFALAATGKVIQADKVSGIDAAKNYIEQGDAEVKITGINQYNDGASSRPVDCTGGTGSLTMARSSTNAIEDKWSWIVSKGASNLQGHGISIDFTAPKVKAMTLAARYMVDSGTFAAGTTGASATDSDLIFYIFDVTNNRIIEPSTFRLYSNQTTWDELYTGEFQTSSDSTSYRLCMHVATTSASAWSLKLDEITAAISKYKTGTVVTDWRNYTPVFTGLGSVSIEGAIWRQVGDSLDLKITAATGTTAASVLSWTLPNNAAVDPNKNASTTNTNSHGIVYNTTKTTTGYASTAVGGYPVFSDTSVSSTVLYVADTNSGSRFAKANGSTLFTTGDRIRIEVEGLPILGWSSTSQQSDGYDGRKVAFRVKRNTSTLSIPNSSTTTITPYSSITEDTHGSFNNTTGVYTCGVPATLNVSGFVSWAGNGTGSRILYLMKNGSVQKSSIVGTPANASSFSQEVNDTIPCKSGDTLSLAVFQNSGGALDLSDTISGNQTATFSGTMVSGSSTISATAGVGFSASQSTTAASTTQPFIYSTVDHNTHGAYSATTGKFIVPAPGRYFFIAGYYCGAAACRSYIYKNGSGVIYGTQSTASTAPGIVMGTLNLKTDDVIEIRPDASVTAGSGATLNYFSGFRIGL